MSTRKPLELVFKQVDGLDIYIDVYIPSIATKENPAPALLWWHGGGLIQGTRKGVAPHLARAPEKHGLCIISADYRLAPQTRLPDILTDCSSVMHYLHSEAFIQATSGLVDSQNRLVVSGSSAGGFLSLAAGTKIGYEDAGVTPPPDVQGIVALYPMTDPLDPFWTTKQRPVSFMDHIIPHEEVAEYLDPNSPKTCFSALDSPRNIFAAYMLQEALLQSLLLDGTGLPPSAFSIASRLKSGLFKVPPTFIFHGEIDDKVPMRQGLDVYEVLKAVPDAVIEYEERKGLSHSLDMEEGEEMDRMYSFIKKLF